MQRGPEKSSHKLLNELAPSDLSSGKEPKHSEEIVFNGQYRFHRLDMTESATSQNVELPPDSFRKGVQPPGRSSVVDAISPVTTP